MQNQFLVSAIQQHSEKYGGQLALELFSSDAESTQRLTWRELTIRQGAIAQEFESFQLSERSTIRVFASAGTSVLLEPVLLSLGFRVEIIDDILFKSASFQQPAVWLVEDQFLDLLETSESQQSFHLSSVSGLTLFADRALNSGTWRSSGVTTYSSGSTGQPKTIFFDMKQVYGAVTAISKRYPEISTGQRTCSWMPLSALYQRMLNYIALFQGVTLSVFDHPKQILDELTNIRPHYFAGVPWLFEQLTSPQYEHILKKLCHSELLFVMSGSAKLAPLSQKMFAQYEIPLVEAYGVSECILPIAANSVEGRRSGTVGKPFCEQSVTIAEDGEVVLESSYLAFNSQCPENTHFRTGDIGFFDEDGFLRLTGRKSDTVKLSNGKRVSLAELESHYFSSHVCSAISILQNDEAPFELYGVIVCKAYEQAQFACFIEQQSQSLASFKRVQKWIVTDREFTVKEGIVTRNGKVKRTAVFEKYSCFFKEATHFSRPTKDSQLEIYQQC